MNKVLFVCHGNICRSPMAEYVFADLVRQAGREGDFEIASAATSTEEIGADVYHPVKRLLGVHGVPCPRRRARQITQADVERFDLIICMDDRNVTNLRRLLGGSASSLSGKLHKLMEYSGSSSDVADPWYTRDFEACYRDVLAGCRGLLQKLTA